MSSTPGSNSGGIALIPSTPVTTVRWGVSTLAESSLLRLRLLAALEATAAQIFISDNLSITVEEPAAANGDSAPAWLDRTSRAIGGLPAICLLTWGYDTKLILPGSKSTIIR